MRNWSRRYVPWSRRKEWVADYASTGVTLGRHPIAHYRQQLRAMEVIPARDLMLLRHGLHARIAGCVIARLRPSTASGRISLSIEDKTGISNAIVDPDLYEANRSLVTSANSNGRGRSPECRQGYPYPNEAH
jgi:error-prone DNA polymerase